MAVTYTFNEIQGGLTVARINTELQAIQEALLDAVSRSGDTPNEMNADLDMNSNKILNVAICTNNLDAANKQYVDSVAAGGGPEGLTAEDITALINGVESTLQVAIDSLQSQIDTINSLISGGVGGGSSGQSTVEVALDDDTAVTWDMQSQAIASWIVGANSHVLQPPTNAFAGAEGQIAIRYEGAFTPDFDSDYDFGDNTPTWSSDSTKMDLLSVTYRQGRPRCVVSTGYTVDAPVAPDTVWDSSIATTNNMALELGDLKISMFGALSGACPATSTNNTLKRYLELRFDQFPTASGGNTMFFGLAPSTPTIDASEAFGFYDRDGAVSYFATAGAGPSQIFLGSGGAKSVVANVATAILGSTLMVAWDTTTGDIWFGMDGTWFTGDPATGTDPVSNTGAGEFQPVVRLNSNDGPNIKVTLHARDEDFSFTLPSSFVAWGT